MRTPSDLPRRERVTQRSRVGLVVFAVALFVLATSLRGIAGFWTDYMWFDSLGLSSVWRGVLGAKVALGAIFTAVFFALLWGNLFIADRLAPRFRPAGPEEDVVERYHELVGGRTGLVRVAVALLFALIAGVPVSGHWNDWILFVNAQDFGQEDPQFGMDIGFFVFQLPFLKFVVDWLFASVVIVIIVAAVAHYLNGGIRVQTPGQRVTPQVKAHVSVLLGVLALIKAAGYYLQRFELSFSSRGVVDGAGHTDVKAQLPALDLLILISLAAFVLFIVNIRRRGWTLPVLAVGLWALVAVIAGGIYPAFVQRVQVEPSESSKEAEYIGRNIEATRDALNLEVETTTFNYFEDVGRTADDLNENAETIRNVRLLDPDVVGDTYQRLQGVNTFYEFPDLDVDRYEIGGRTTQVVLSARELVRDRVPQDSWEARQLAYTHGYGLALSPANGVTENGRPNFVVGDLPPEAPEELELEQPAIYFGERIGGYSIVNTERDEIDYVGEEGTVLGNYEGEGGVRVGGWLRRAAFALRFAEPNLMFSGLIGQRSQILYIRDVRERVEMLAPFLHYDADPYPVIVDGRIVYVIDAYTTSNRYPYAQRADTRDVPPGSGLRHDFNYVRNSVKAVVDAYDGTVAFYMMDPEDPILQAYRKAFPSLFDSLDDMPDGLKDNLRYPEDIFRVQTSMWGRYHLDNTQTFYEQSASWVVAEDPGTSAEQAPTTATTDPTTGQLGTAQSARIEPYYQLMQLPGEEDPSFVILRPFVPFSENDNRQELRAFMVAESDFEDYGKLRAYELPTGNLADGPAIVHANILADADIAARISLLDQRGSSVQLGNLMLIPVQESIMYVRPLYVEARGDTAVPLLEHVIVSYGGRSVMADTLREAIEELFSVSLPTEEEAPDPEDDDELDEDDGPVDGTTPEARVAELLADAAAALDAADAALRAGNLAEYQDQVEEAQELVQEANELSNPTTTTTPESTA